MGRVRKRSECHVTKSLNNEVIILGIETSCDETSAAILVNGTELRSHIISSQITTHQKYGGVVPEIASREHSLHQDIEFPLLALLVSGGHTHLIFFEAHGQFKVLGHTRDDASGEALDKVARTLGLGYPGGPQIQRIAQEGNAQAFKFPRAMLEKDSLDFSFSGMKSAVLNTLNSARMRGETLSVPDIAASFQQAVVDVLVQKTLLAIKQTGVKTLLLAGGVAANSLLRETLSETLGERSVRLVYPRPLLCTDNGAMIATAGYYHYLAENFAPWTLNAVPGLRLV